jgi:hypothetical protein
VLQVADSYPLSASRALTNEELALLGAALIGYLTDPHKNGGWRKNCFVGVPTSLFNMTFINLVRLGSF